MQGAFQRRGVYKSLLIKELRLEDGRPPHLLGVVRETKVRDGLRGL